MVSNARDNRHLELVLQRGSCADYPADIPRISHPESLALSRPRNWDCLVQQCWMDWICKSLPHHDAHLFRNTLSNPSAYVFLRDLNRLGHQKRLSRQRWGHIYNDRLRYRVPIIECILCDSGLQRDELCYQATHCADSHTLDRYYH